MSSDSSLSPVLRELLATSIRSVEEIDLIFYLHRDGGPRTALELATAMRVAEATAVGVLLRLVLSRIVVQEGDSSPSRYVLAPTRAELREAVDELVRVYEDCRLDILLLISTNALERVRSGARRAFSDPSWSPGRKRGT
jgi:hypothetical protein